MKILFSQVPIEFLRFLLDSVSLQCVGSQKKTKVQYTIIQKIAVYNGFKIKKFTENEIKAWPKFKSIYYFENKYT